MEKSPIMTTLNAIKQQRNLTNVAIARALGVSPSTAGNIMRGTHAHTYSDEQIAHLADVLGITFERCWFAMCESYNEYMGTPGTTHIRASELRAQAETALLTKLPDVPIEVSTPRPLASVEGVVVVPEERRIESR